MFQRIWIRKKFNQTLESLVLQRQNRVSSIPYPVGFILPNCEIDVITKGYGGESFGFFPFFVQFGFAKGDNVLYSGGMRSQ